MSVLIVGGGIIGLSIGWQLARQNISVAISDRGNPTSWKAAGMLAPFSEAGFEDAEKLKLGQEGLSLYPQFLRELEEDSGERIPLESKGTLFVALNKNDRNWLEWIYDFKEKQGLPLSWVDKPQELEPLLSPRVICGIHLPTERQINHRALLGALKKAFLACGGEFKTVEAETVIIAAGAWSGAGVRPVKGQILSLRGIHLDHMIRSPRVYLVSKSDGTLRIGATSEEKGFDETVTAGAILGLLQNAWELLPGMDEYPIESLEAGLRPTTANDLPLVEERTPGIFYATGHGRGGILLAPWTAYKMVQLYEHRTERKQSDAGADDLGRIFERAAHHA